MKVYSHNTLSMLAQHAQCRCCLNSKSQCNLFCTLLVIVVCEAPLAMHGKTWSIICDTANTTANSADHTLAAGQHMNFGQFDTPQQDGARGGCNPQGWTCKCITRHVRHTVVQAVDTTLCCRIGCNTLGLLEPKLTSVTFLMRGMTLRSYLTAVLRSTSVSIPEVDPLSGSWTSLNSLTFQGTNLSKRPLQP